MKHPKVTATKKQNSKPALTNLSKAVDAALKSYDLDASTACIVLDLKKALDKPDTKTIPMKLYVNLVEFDSEQEKKKQNVFHVPILEIAYMSGECDLTLPYSGTEALLAKAESMMSDYAIQVNRYKNNWVLFNKDNESTAMEVCSTRSMF